MSGHPLLPSLLFAACLAAGVPVAGAAVIEVQVQGVEGELRDNVIRFLSIKRYATATDLDQDLVDRLALRAAREARAALKPFGYYEPEVTTTIATIETGWRAVVAIEPGEPVILIEADVGLTGPGRDEDFLTQVVGAAQLAVGQRLRHADYDRLKGELQRVAASHGYLDATWTRAVLQVDVGAREARALLTLDTGERYRFGETTFEQDFLDAELVYRFLRYRPGDWFDATALLRTQFALDDSEYFSRIEVSPLARDQEAGTVPVRITADQNKRHRYRVGAGYATDTEFRGLLGYTNRQLNRRGHRLSAEARVSSVEQRIDVNYIIPWEDPALEKLSLRVLAGTVENGDIETTGVTFRPGLTQVLGRWQRVLFANVDYTSDSAPSPDPDDKSRVATGRSLLVAPGISFALLPKGVIDPGTVGSGLYAELLGSTSALGSDSEFLRLLVRDERRFDLGGPWHLLLRGELGASAVGDFQELPALYRFFAGGDRSVRGYGYEELSPTDAEGNKIGGRHKLVASVEFERDLPRNFVVAAFFDAGNAFNKFGDPLEYSVGIGLRYRLPFVSVGLDVAQSLSESDRSPRLHFNFTPIL